MPRSTGMASALKAYPNGTDVRKPTKASFGPGVPFSPTNSGVAPSAELFELDFLAASREAYPSSFPGMVDFPISLPLARVASVYSTWYAQSIVSVPSVDSSLAVASHRWPRTLYQWWRRVFIELRSYVRPNKAV